MFNRNKAASKINRSMANGNSDWGSRFPLCNPTKNHQKIVHLSQKCAILSQKHPGNGQNGSSQRKIAKIADFRNF